MFPLCLTDMTKEAYALIASALCGAGSVMLYDVFRAIRLSVKQNGFFVFLEDVIFWCVCTAAMWNCLWRFNNGEVRAFEIAGFVIGALLYILTLQKLFFVLFKVIFKNIFKFIHLIFQILLTPPKFLYKILLVPLCAKLKHTMGKTVVGKDKLE